MTAIESVLNVTNPSCHPAEVFPDLDLTFEISNLIALCARRQAEELAVVAPVWRLYAGYLHVEPD